ncbi:MAG: Fe(2+) transporter permease subunit FeoB [Pseudohongiellaceae bacterium]
MKNIALISNPNSGKTTLFNLLTGTRQKVGNWPGVTVEKKVGRCTLGDVTIELVDLPGLYSLEQAHQGLDEKIARDFIRGGGIDLAVNVIDTANLERSLVLTQQLLEQDIPVLVVLNMLDVAEQQGIKVNATTLARRLQVPVVSMIAARGIGKAELCAAIEELVGEGVVHGHGTDERDAHAHDVHKRDTHDTGERSAMRERNTNAQHKPKAQHANPQEQEDESVLRRYHRSRKLLNGVMEVYPEHDSLSERLDRVVLNRWLGIPIFLFMIYMMFTVAVNLGAVFIDFFDILFGAVLVDGTTWLLQRASMPAVVVTLLAQGVGGGITLVATFIPVIGFLYLCLSVLEDSGYMSRAAFVIDRLMSSIGLPGNAFVPLIVGFGCNVPAVMASRTLGRDSERLLTIAMAPFMSCGARLTVYALFAAAFFQSNGQNIVFGLYLLGIALAIFTGWIFRKQLFTNERSHSIQEMPAYHIPVTRNILLTTWFRLKSFIFRAGKMIVGVVIVLSFLNSIGTDGTFNNENSEESVLSAIGKSITPAFTPLGIERDNWPATVGLFTGMFAKEAIVGTLDALYSEPAAADTEAGPPALMAATADAFASIGTELRALSGALTDPLGISIGNVSDAAAVAEEQEVNDTTLTNMALLFGSPFAAFCYLLFVLLYAPCVAVLGAVHKEAGWHWMLLVFSWSTGLAYITATTTYQLGTFAANPLFSSVWIVAMMSILTLFIIGLRRLSGVMVPNNLIRAVQVG